MMRTNTIRPNHSQAGYVVFKAKNKKIQSLELNVNFGNNKHVLKF